MSTTEIIAVVIQPPEIITVKIQQTDPIVIKVNDGQTGPTGATGSTGAPGPTGAAGPPIVEVNSYTSPTTLSNAAQILAPVNQREKRYISGNASPVTGITIAAGSGTQELYLYGVDGINTAQLVSSATVRLSGTWLADLDALICLHWTQGLNKWVEAHRNEL